LRQSDDAADADHADNAIPNIQASMTHKNLFMVIRRKNKNCFNKILYNDLNIKVKSFFKNVNIVLVCRCELKFRLIYNMSYN